MMSPRPRELASLRRAVGETKQWPWDEPVHQHQAMYTMAAAPKGGLTYTGENLGLTK